MFIPPTLLYFLVTKYSAYYLSVKGQGSYYYAGIICCHVLFKYLENSLFMNGDLFIEPQNGLVPLF